MPQPEGQEDAYLVFRQLMNGDLQGAEYFESRVKCRDGSLRLIAWHNTPLDNESGEIAGTLGSGQDVTESRRYLRALERGEYADKLFEPFQRVHGSHELPGIGIGIGLATVRRIIHRHGGQVSGKGRVGRGATFCFTMAAPEVEEG